MNGKNQSQSRQDSEELLVTSSTSSSNLVEARATTSTPSSSPTTTTRTAEPSLSATTSTPSSSTGKSLCQIVTSSTGNNSNSASNLDEDDDDDTDTVISTDDQLNLLRVSDGNNQIQAASTPEMGGPSSNNDGETCVVLPSSSSYIEQRNDNNKNMLLTTRSSESDGKIESSVPSVSSVVSAPTTRSRRKLLNIEAAGTTALGLNHSITLNNSKCINLDVKNHQAAKKKSTATTAASSINSISHSNDTVKVATPSIGGKNLGTLKNCEDSAAGSSSSSKRNCVVNDDVSTESQNERDDVSNSKLVANSTVDSNDDSVADNRKVEPLKINLNRDMVKTKITIKPIIKPPGTDGEQLVPKLTIKSSSNSTSVSCAELKSSPVNCVDQQQHNEPHIVPKLTIRASDCNSSSLTNSDMKHSVVPKLTIKMDGALNCVKESTDSSSSSASSSPPPSLPPQPPLPKLTIKTTGDTTESTITSCVSSSSLISSSPTPYTKPTVPKLTIKAISKSSSSSSSGSTSSSSDQSVPLFAITSVVSLATPQSPSTSTTTTSVSDSDNFAIDSTRTNSPIPKLTIKTIQDPESSSTNQTIPRLKIRTKPEQEVVTTSDATTPPAIPKFTIKAVQENEQSIPKLTISVNDRIEASCFSSSSTSDNIPKLTVVRHAEQDDCERVPKLKISLQESPKIKQQQSIDSEASEKHEKIPKLTIKAISEQQDPDGSDKVPKLTIKTVSSLEADSPEKIPKLTIKTISEQSTETDKIAKLTIKTVTDDELDNNSKLMIKPISEQEAQPLERIPKLTIRSHSDEEPHNSEQAVKDKSEKLPKLTIKSSITEVEEKIPKLTIKTVTEQSEVDKVPKLTIKSFSNSDETIEKVPKLTIKQISDSKEKVPKLTIRQVQESDESDRTTLVSTISEQSESCARIPKLTIKPVPETDDFDNSNDNVKIPKLKIKNIAEFGSAIASSTEKLPKLTIKTITGTDSDEPTEKKSKLVIQQSSTICENLEKVPKLTIKQISNNFHDASSSCSSPKVPKLTINNHGTTTRIKRSSRTRKVETKIEDEAKNNAAVEIVTSNPLKITMTQNKVLRKDNAMEGGSKKSKNDPGDAADSKAMEIDQELNAAEVSIALDVAGSNSKNDHDEKKNETSKSSTIDSSKADFSESSNAASSIERELQIITAQSNTGLSRKLSSNTHSDMEIDADLSDDAINDLADILNDELNATIDSNREENTSKISKCEISTIPDCENVGNDRNMIETKSHTKTNIPDDSISLESDEDDIVDQLAELLNEPNEMGEIADQILQDRKIMESNSKNEATQECITETLKLEAEVLEEVQKASNEVDMGNMTKQIRHDGKIMGSDSQNESDQFIAETLKLRAEVLDNKMPSSSNFEISKKPSVVESQKSDVVRIEKSSKKDHSSDLNENNQTKRNCLQVDDRSLLQSLLSQNIVNTDSGLIGSKLIENFDTKLNCLNSVRQIKDETQRIGLESTAIDSYLTLSELKGDLAINIPERKTKLKRSANDSNVFRLSPSTKKLRSGSTAPDELTADHSLSSDIMIVQENNCPTSFVKRGPSSIVDLENSSLTGDETFHTLTELKTINNVVLRENDEGSMSAKDQDDNNVNLKEILTRLHQNENSQTSQNSFKSGNNKINHKSSEPEISVILSTPPHSNSLKSTQNILLINEESGSDCMIVEDDPLMILQNSIDELNGKKNLGIDSDFDISSSAVGDTVMEMASPPIKRPRGRPRKDGQPAGSVKKKEDPSSKRKFKGVLMDSHNSMVERRKILSPSEILEPITPTKVAVDEKIGSPGILGAEFPSTPPKTIRRRGRGGGPGSRGGRGRGSGRGARSRCVGGLSHTPEKKKDGEFFTPDRRKKPELKPPLLQVFEEDTRMSADSFTTPVRQSEIVNNLNPDDNTQSSVLSIGSVLDGSSNTGTAPPTTEKKRRAKMEVFAPEGKTEYTVDMICEYDWPPPKGCCPARNRDTFMIQEQIAQYLGIKSFKRKYPDLPRRQVDMEERNYLQEKGLVTEKMCDLGITAVWASDVLDIMYSDFYEKYEEYKTYLREKQLRDIEAKQRAMAAEAVDKSLQARERALESASKWNCNFNKARKEDRRLCLDLQSLVINLPAAIGNKLSRPNETQISRQSSDYPIALVPGQFAENYRVYSPRELRCYPINTILDPFDDRLRPKVEHNDDEEDDSLDESESESSSTSSSSGSDSDTSNSSDSDSTSNVSSDDEEDKPPDSNKNKCFVCHQPPNKNRNGYPEVFIRCVTCRKRTHPSCIEMPSRMVMRIRNYNWQCADCKCCIKCKRKQDESKMLYCEQCDRGFHIYCIQIKTVPDGRWHCERCAICMRCGSTKAEGNLPPPPLQPNQKPSRKKAKWVNEYRVDHITKLREHSSILCVPCARSKTKQRTITS